MRNNRLPFFAIRGLLKSFIRSLTQWTVKLAETPPVTFIRFILKRKSWESRFECILYQKSGYLSALNSAPTPENRSPSQFNGCARALSC